MTKIFITDPAAGRDRDGVGKSARQEAVELAQRLEAEQKRGFFSKLFGRGA